MRGPLLAIQRGRMSALYAAGYTKQATGSIREMKTLTVTTHYFESDPEFLGDYAEVSISLDGKTLRVFGDACHERGRERAEGFVEGFSAATSEALTVERRQVADYA